MKDPYFLMKIMASSMTLDKLKVAKTRRYIIERSVPKEKNQFQYDQLFGLYFRYKHQVDKQKNLIHAPIFKDITWMTILFPDPNFSWYLTLLEVNIALASGHFQNYGVVQPSMYFRRALAI